MSKQERKEVEQNKAKCPFCAEYLGWKITEFDRLSTDQPIKPAFLICLDCLTGGELPTDQDLKQIRKGWEKGGLLLTNIKKYPHGEQLLLKMVEEALETDQLRVYWEDEKVYMESPRGGITIELNIYRNSKEETK